MNATSIVPYRAGDEQHHVRLGREFIYIYIKRSSIAKHTLVKIVERAEGTSESSAVLW